MNTNTLYLDMDGVVADWNAGVQDIIGYTLKNHNDHYPDQDWNKITKHQRLYRDLPLTQGAKELVSLARQFRDRLGWDLNFLTAIPHGNDVPWAFYDKVNWAKKYFDDIPVHFGPYSKDKWKHCKPGDILVDDKPSNIAEWRKAGGIAIQVTPSELDDAIIKLRVHYDRFLLNT
jgi:5'(3')-deoxyribonucleotidase